MNLFDAKIVNDIKAAGDDECAEISILEFDKRFSLGTVLCGPGKMQFFEINCGQMYDWSVTTNAENKPDALNEYQITRHRKEEYDCQLNSIEKAFFASTNTSLGFI